MVVKPLKKLQHLNKLDLKRLTILANDLRSNLLNPYAKELSNPKYKQKVIKNKKKYNRKKVIKDESQNRIDI